MATRSEHGSTSPRKWRDEARAPRMAWEIEGTVRGITRALRDKCESRVTSVLMPMGPGPAEQGSKGSRCRPSALLAPRLRPATDSSLWDRHSTASDLNRQAGRAYSSLSVVALEIELAEVVRRLGRRVDVLSLLPQKVARAARSRLTRRSEANVEVNVVAEMNLSHLFQVIGPTPTS